MASPPPSPPSSNSTCSSSSSSTSITDIDLDSLVNCVSYLKLQDVLNMAMTAKLFKSFAYSDPVWRYLFRQRWPSQMSSSLLPTSGVREAYLAKHIALQQFRFIDPSSVEFTAGPRSYKHILLDKNNIILSQDSNLVVIDVFSLGKELEVTLRDHKARITCMRLFSLLETSYFRSEAQKEDKVLVTSSYDHTIRLWWKGKCQRCFRGHSGPVTTLADKLLGDCSGKALASGGVDGTIRLWSLASSGKRGQQALKTTYYGHEKPIALLSVSGHKPSLLVSISKDAKVRVWDTATSSSSSSRSSGCVGMTSLPFAPAGLKYQEPIGMKCYESLIYVASGPLVTAIDLRTMQKALTPAVQLPKFYSFNMLPSKFLVCTGGNDKAMLWDIRKSQDKPAPVAEFGHDGPVAHLHMDQYKVVTGTPVSSDINVWEPSTGELMNTIKCCYTENPVSSHGCSAMAVNGCRIVTASMVEEQGCVCYRDYTHATSPIPSNEGNVSSKFWETGIHSDSDD